MAEESYSGPIQKYNMLLGILLCTLITGVFYMFSISFFIGIIFRGDLFYIIGSIAGLYVTFKYRKESQTHLKTGIIVALAGAVFSILFIIIVDWVLLTLLFGSSFSYLISWAIYILGANGIFYILVGLILGYFYGSYFMKKEVIREESPLI